MISAKPRILILGDGRHGKDTVADFLVSDFGFRAVSSSEFACRAAVFPLMSDLYSDWRACFEDRANHRDLWFHAIKAYNLRPGPTLAEQILVDHDIYVGMRCPVEFDNSRQLFDVVIWVDRSGFLPAEPKSSNGISASDADFIIDNNGDLTNLRRNVKNFMAAL